MSSKLALLRGTSRALYAHLDNDLVLLMKEDYKYFATKLRTFYELYYELSDTVAALKEDCIDYTVYKPGQDFLDYPDWFITAYDNGYIYTEDGYDDYIMYGEHGDIVFSPGGIILCNFLGQVTYMERFHFLKHYEVIGGLDDEF